jgi:hypothetical protein
MAFLKKTFTLGVDSSTPAEVPFKDLRFKTGQARKYIDLGDTREHVLDTPIYNEAFAKAPRYYNYEGGRWARPKFIVDVIAEPDRMNHWGEEEGNVKVWTFPQNVVYSESNNERNNAQAKGKYNDFGVFTNPQLSVDNKIAVTPFDKAYHIDETPHFHTSPGFVSPTTMSPDTNPHATYQDRVQLITRVTPAYKTGAPIQDLAGGTNFIGREGLSVLVSRADAPAPPTTDPFVETGTVKKVDRSYNPFIQANIALQQLNAMAALEGGATAAQLDRNNPFVQAAITLQAKPVNMEVLGMAMESEGTRINDVTLPSAEVIPVAIASNTQANSNPAYMESVSAGLQSQEVMAATYNVPSVQAMPTPVVKQRVGV